MKKISVALLVLLIFITGCSIKDLFVKENESEELMSGKISVNIDVKDYGIIKLELDADNTPITVTNFVNLAKNGFYDGNTFHRLMTGFVLQGGDPTGSGMGGPNYSIKGEFSNNGFDNSL